MILLQHFPDSLVERLRAALIVALLLIAPPALSQTPMPGGSGGGSLICEDCTTDPPIPPDSPPPPALDASFVAQSVPSSMYRGQSYTATIQMKNLGTQTWTTATYFSLGSQNPQDNTVWGVRRIALAGSIAQGQIATFNFSFKAPTSPGTYNFQWRMVQDGVAWFGASAPNIAVTVKVPNTLPSVQITSPVDSSSLAAPASFSLTAAASDQGGSIASVAFWSNGILLGTDTSSPYSWPVSGLAAGSYQFRAVATDNQGASNSSSAVNLTVTGTAGSTVSATRTYVYDSSERLCKTINPESGATLLDYDAAGNVAWVAEGTALTGATCDRTSVSAAQKLVRSYDELSRLIRVTTPGGVADLTQSYFPDGQVQSLSVMNPGGFKVTTSYIYNKRRLLTGESSANGSTLFGLVYGYNANGSLSTLTYPDNHVVAFAPDALGRATRITGTGGVAYANAIQYGPNGAVTSFGYGNKFTHMLTSNARMLPARSVDSATVDTLTTTAIDDSYTYDANGNVTDITDQAQAGQTTRGMAYDGLDRLTAAVSPKQWGNAVYGYDALDNLRVADLGARQYRYAYDTTNRLVNIKNPAGSILLKFAYDSRGNTTSKSPVGSTQAYGFDIVNRLSQVTGLQTYRYDGLGRRVQTTDSDGKTTYWIYSRSGQVLYTSEARRSQNLAYIYLGNTLVATRAVAWGSGLASVRYQHTDALGTPVAESDKDRHVVARNSYTPYGEGFNYTGPDGVGYTGHVMDRATGLTYMQQRYYDPQTARFISLDPDGIDQLTAANFSRLAYGNNNPYRFSDPDGRQSVQELIDQSGERSAASGDRLGTFGWAFLSTTWRYLGAEGLSQVLDKGSNASSTDKFAAGLEILTLGKASSVEKAGGHFVYQAVSEGRVIYVGITTNLERRAAQHLAKKAISISPIPGLSGLSKLEARSVEQVLIELHGIQKQGGTLLNKINSIAKTNPKYAEALKTGQRLLRAAGYEF